MKREILITALLICCLAPPAGAAEYAEGQIWRYLTRPGEEGSRLYIARIDAEERHGPIYHLYVDGLRIGNPLAPGGIQDHMPHIPVDRKTLDGSVTELIGTVPNPPDVTDGYDLWRAAFDKGSAGVFTIPVSAIVQAIEDSIGQWSDKR